MNSACITLTFQVLQSDAQVLQSIPISVAPSPLHHHHLYRGAGVVVRQGCCPFAVRNHNGVMRWRKVMQRAVGEVMAAAHGYPAFRGHFSLGGVAWRNGWRCKSRAAVVMPRRRVGE
jgi:hypothetical protein